MKPTHSDPFVAAVLLYPVAIGCDAFFVIRRIEDARLPLR